jgi:hypothetical protein
MSNVAQNLLQYTTNAMAAYGSNNAASGAMPAGWTAVKVDAFNPSTTGFAGQLMTDGQGNYRISIRGTDSWNPLNPANELSLNAAYATGKWHAQMDDAIRFTGEAMKQIRETQGLRSVDQVRSRLDGSAHSAGGGLYELAAKFFGLRGINLDGPGVGKQVQSERFTQLKLEQRNNGLADLQDNYQWSAGDFQRRQYSAIGEAGQNTPGVEVYVSPSLQKSNNTLANIYQAGVETGSTGLWVIGSQIGAQHGLGSIAKLEGFGNAMQTQSELFVQQNLAKGLTASGYAEGSHQYETLGGSGMAFSVSVYRNDAGQLVEVRVPGQWVGGSFQAKGAPTVSVADANGKVHALGISDPVDSMPDVVITVKRIQEPTAGRNSANYITDTYANDHMAIIKTGGTLSDLWVVQKGQTNGFANEKEFYAAVLASNPGITDVNKIPAGTSIYLPQKLSDGSVTYHYAGGTAINSNAATGEYHMVVPNTDGSGGQTIYSRQYVGDIDGPNGTLVAQYAIKQISTDAQGSETFNYKGFQTTREGDIQPAGVAWQTDTERGSSSFDGDIRTDAVTDKATGATTLTATDEETGQSKTVAVRTSGMSAEDVYNGLMYGSMAGFLNAMRGKDKLGMALNGAKMIVDTAMYNNKGNVPSDVMSGASKAIAGLSATVGIVAGLNALQSKDTLTQLNGVVGLLSSANSLALQSTDPEALQLAWSKARQAASQQEMKVITLDWNGDGVIKKVARPGVTLRFSVNDSKFWSVA